MTRLLDAPLDLLAIAPHPDDFAEAACAGMDPETFFPVSDGHASSAQVAHAKAVCAPCPVRRRCLREALRLGDTEGIWGGLTAAERREMSLLLRHSGLSAAELVSRVLAGQQETIPRRQVPATVAALLLRGWSDPQIAARLGIGTHAVRRVRGATTLLEHLRASA
ncbi:hypothetical protein ABH931_000324 [Streptacidiphilus sp. MAP12-33]|uniref:WhiB family transcriptional regulator n=1 Tax=Streptacidiphilus sp. MAP12-33 TaxID=3156266 RepID=UPI003511729A